MLSTDFEPVPHGTPLPYPIDPPSALARRLQSFPLFADLLLDEIERALPLMNVANYPRRTCIFHVQEPADAVYMLISGLVKVSYMNLRGDEKTISLFQAGDIFGELFLGKYPLRIGTACVLEDACVLKIYRTHLTTLLTRFPALNLRFIAHLADEQRELLARLHALMHTDARHRLLGTLLSLARRTTASDALWVELPYSLTQEVIANLACLNRSTANILINQLRAEGILGGGGRRLLVNRSAVQAWLDAEGTDILE